MLGLWLWGIVSAGADEVSAEGERLHRELATLAQRNAWPGVARAYGRLEALGVPLTVADYALGAHAARVEGDVLIAIERLERAAALPGQDLEAVARSLADLKAGYGYVNVTVYTPQPGVLERAAMPFVPEDQEAIRFAARRIHRDRRFLGMLPIGTYTLQAGDSSVPFDVQAGAPMAHVRLGEPANSGSTGQP